MKVLATKFGVSAPPCSAPDATSRPGRSLAPFQSEAVRAILESLDRHRGALLADSPGLGKTHVALAVAREGSPSLFVLPAALVEAWRSKAARGGESIAWVTHERMSRGALPVSLGTRATIVVDEAHAFRNPATIGYRRLAALCSGKRVLLVTATPVNNSLEDLYHLLRLFVGDTAFASIGVPELSRAIRTGDGMDGVLAAVMTRRTRETIAASGVAQVLETATGRQPVRFPSREVVEARIRSGEGSPEAFGAIVSGFTSLMERSPLLAFLLAKRLASSARALVATLERLRMPGGASPEGGLQGRLPFLAEELECAAPDEVILPRRDHERFVRTELPRLLEAARRLEAAGDPKARALAGWLDGDLANRKTVVFTEFRDTAAMLYRSLASRPRVGWMHGGGACIASGACSRGELLARFAPVASGRPGLPPHEEIRTLIATDVLSEGLDLQDAECAVSYDLPWNPVRLLQRAGRIDRIGSPHRSIRVLHLLPDPDLDDLLRLLERLARKGRAIVSAVGVEEGPERPPLLAVGRAGAGGVDGGPRAETWCPERPLEDESCAESREPGGGDEPGRSREFLARSRGRGDSAFEIEARAASPPAFSDATTLLRADHARFMAGAPGALRRAFRLPGGVFACSRGAELGGEIVACWAIASTRACMTETMIWLRWRAGSRCELLEEGRAVELLRAAERSGAALSFVPDDSWRRPMALAAGRVADRLASAGAARASSRSPAIRALLRKLQASQRACRMDRTRSARLDSLESCLSGSLDAGLEARLSRLSRRWASPSFGDESLTELERLLAGQALLAGRAPLAGDPGAACPSARPCRLLGAIRLPFRG